MHRSTLRAIVALSILACTFPEAASHSFIARTSKPSQPRLVRREVMEMDPTAHVQQETDRARASRAHADRLVREHHLSANGNPLLNDRHTLMFIDDAAHRERTARLLRQWDVAQPLRKRPGNAPAADSPEVALMRRYRLRRAQMLSLAGARPEEAEEAARRLRAENRAAHVGWGVGTGVLVAAAGGLGTAAALSSKIDFPRICAKHPEKHLRLCRQATSNTPSTTDPASQASSGSSQSSGWSTLTPKKTTMKEHQ